MLLICRLQNTIKRLLEECIPEIEKQYNQKLVNPIIPLERPEKEDLKPSDYIDHVFHNFPGNSNSEKYTDVILALLKSGSVLCTFSRRS